MLPIGHKSSQNGFTLVEILITVSILSLATVFIVQSNLINLSAFSRYENRLDVQQWALEKIAQTKKEILESEAPNIGVSAGSLSGKSREYNWRLTVDEESTKFGSAYLISLRIAWFEGSHEALMERYSGLVKKQAA